MSERNKPVVQYTGGRNYCFFGMYLVGVYDFPSSPGKFQNIYLKEIKKPSFNIIPYPSLTLSLIESCG
jgi:hypothetical protein